MFTGAISSLAVSSIPPGMRKTVLTYMRISKANIDSVRRKDSWTIFDVSFNFKVQS